MKIPRTYEPCGECQRGNHHLCMRYFNKEAKTTCRCRQCTNIHAVGVATIIGLLVIAVCMGIMFL